METIGRLFPPEGPMIESIDFANFKALRKASLPLSPFTLLLGPNGSGKTSVLQAIGNMASLAANQGGIVPLPQAFGQAAWSSLRSATAENQHAPVNTWLKLS